MIQELLKEVTGKDWKHIGKFDFSDKYECVLESELVITAWFFYDERFDNRIMLSVDFPEIFQLTTSFTERNLHAYWDIFIQDLTANFDGAIQSITHMKGEINA